MATAGSIVVDLLAKTGSFESDLDRARKKLSTVGDDANRVSAQLDKAALALGGIAVTAAAGLVALTARTATAANEIRNLAAVAGASTTEFQRIAVAAQSVGLSQEKVSAQLQDFNEKVGEFLRSGGGGMKEFFEQVAPKIGVTAEAFRNLSGPQGLQTYYNALEKAGLNQKEMSFYLESMASDTTALIPILRNGGAEFERLADRAQRFGLILSAEAIQSAQQLTDNIDGLTQSAHGLKNQISTALLPSLVSVTETLLEIVESIGPVGDKIETALKIAGTSATAVAAIFAGRLLASLVGSVTAFAAATLEVGRYQMALARMAGVSSAAAAGIGAMSTAARVGSALMGILGGPVGLVATLGITAAAFLAMGRDADISSSDIDQLAQSLNTLNREQIALRRQQADEMFQTLTAEADDAARALAAVERDYAAMHERMEQGRGVTPEELQNVNKTLVELRAELADANQRVEQAREVQNRLAEAARNAAGGVQTLNDALAQTDQAGKTYLDRLQGQSIVAGLKTQREQLEAMVKAGVLVYSKDDLERARAYADRIDKANASLRTSTKSMSEAQKAAEAFRKEQERSLASQYQSVSAIHDQAQGLEDQVALYGLSATAIEDLTIARLEERAVILSMYGDKAQPAIEAINAEIEARKRLRAAMGAQEQKEAEKAAWDAWANSVEGVFGRVQQSLTDAIFEGGKDGRELLQDLFRTLTVDLLINPVMKGFQDQVTASMGGMFGYQNPQQQKSSSFDFNQFMGGGTGNMLSSAGNYIGSSMVAEFGAGLTAGAGGALTDASASALMNIGTNGSSSFAAGSSIGGIGLGSIAGYGSALVNLAEGKYGSAAGAAIGTYLLPGIGTAVGSLLGGFADDMFGGGPPATRHGQRTTIDYMGGRFGVSAVDDRQAAGSEQAALAAAQASVTAANELFAKLGVDAAIESFYAVMESSVLGDRQGVASGGMLRTGDDLRQIGIRQSSDMTFAGFGGWSSAEMLPRLATDIQLSILEAFQTQVDSLPDALANMIRGVDVRALDAAGAQDLAARFSAMVQGVSQFQTAVQSLPFDQLRELSFGAAAGLIEAAGGLERLTGNLNTYYQNFHTEAERNAQTLRNIGKALEEVGVALPDTRQQFRALVEAQDLTTDAGRRVYAALLNVSGAFASVTQSAEQAAQESERIAAQNRQTIIDDLQSAYSAAVSAGQAEIARLQQSFGATDTAMNSYRSAVQALESQFGSLFTSIDRYISDLRGNVEASAQAQYRQARAVISTAIATGQLPQTADLTEALQVAQRGVTSQVYADLFEQNRAYAILANEMEALKGIAEPELDAAKATLAQLEEQYALLRGTNRIAGDSLSALEQQVRLAFATEEAARHEISLVEQQMELAKQQHEQLMEALTGIDGGIKSLAEAMADFASAVAAAQRVVSGGGGGGGAGTPAAIDAATRYYAANPDVVNEFNSGTTGMGYDQYAAWHYEKYGQFEGRSYAVGTSYVPHDMLANIHQGEIIINPRDSDILRRHGIRVQGGGADRETAQLLREQLAESREQNRYLREMLKSLIRTAHNTEDTANALGAHSPSEGGAMVVY